MDLEKLWSYKRSSQVEYYPKKEILIERFTNENIKDLNKFLNNAYDYCREKKWFDINFHYYLRSHIEETECCSDCYQESLILNLYAERKGDV